MRELLLAAAVPFQRLVDQPSPTHGFISRQALSILSTDRRRHEATCLRQYLNHFTEGCDWADTDWRNVTHMYDPRTGRGFRGWPSAPSVMNEYWNQAVSAMQAGRPGEAFFYLGMAAHLVQDLCVPHHAAARLFAGHKQFETYASRYRHRYAAHGGGLYSLAEGPADWVIANAEYTRARYSHCVSPHLSRSAVHLAVQDLLPRAQRTTAGLVVHFLTQTGVV